MVPIIEVPDAAVRRSVGVGLESNASYRAEPMVPMPSRGCICW